MEKQLVVFSTVAKDQLPEFFESPYWNPLAELLSLRDVPLRKLYLFIPQSMSAWTPEILSGLRKFGPHVEVDAHIVKLSSDFSPESIGEFYAYYEKFFSSYNFRCDCEEYFFHFAPGNTFSHSFMFTMLINLRKLPCRILLMRNNGGASGSRMEIYDCALNKWVSDICVQHLDHTPDQDFLKSSIHTKNRRFNELIRDIETVAINSRAAILLCGPTGSGKSQLARRIYDLRKRKGMASGRFVSVNCSTLRGESALSNLFGHVKGSFTGAVSNREGFLKMAHGGILFLDEIGELSLDIQVLLLKAIEEKSFIPFGADEPAQSDFQLICATNKDLQEECARGNFRLDLLSRIDLWQFYLPPLAERPEDIEPNIDYELKRLTAASGVLTEFLPQARKLYVDFATSTEAVWPGNFRSLAGSMERMGTYANNGRIGEMIVKKEIAHLSSIWSRAEDAQARFPLLAKLGEEYANLDLFDKIQLEGVLAVCLKCRTKSEAGRRLYAGSRLAKRSRDDTSRLNKYLQAHNLTWERIEELRIS